MKEQETNNTIDLMQLLQICRKHIWTLIFWAAAFGIVAFALSAFILPEKYTSSAQILVNQKSSKNDPNTAYVTQQANMQLVTTYKDIVTSPVILQKAADDLENPVRVVKAAKPAVYERNADGTRRLVRAKEPAVIARDGKPYYVTTHQLAKSISVSTQQQSQVFKINATANNADKAQAEANAVSKVFKKQIPSIMDVNNVTIVAPATPGVKSSPNVKLYTIAGVVLGVVLSLAVILVREMSDTTVRRNDYLINTLGLTDLGQISHFNVSPSFRINGNKHSNKRRRV